MTDFSVACKQAQTKWSIERLQAHACSLILYLLRRKEIIWKIQSIKKNPRNLRSSAAKFNSCQLNLKIKGRDNFKIISSKREKRKSFSDRRFRDFKYRLVSAENRINFTCRRGNIGFFHRYEQTEIG